MSKLQVAAVNWVHLPRGRGQWWVIMGTPIKLQVVQRTDRISASLLIRLKFLPLCYVVDFLRVKKRGVCYFFRMNTEILSFY